MHFFWQADQAAHRAEEIVISSHKSMKDEESKSIAAMKAFELVEKKIQYLNIKLTKVERAKKSAETALNRVEK